MRKTLLLIICYLATFTLNAKNLIDENEVKEEKSCFSWIFEDYDKWRDTVKEARSQQLKDDNALRENMEQFDRTFGRKDYMEYKNNLDCSTFKYEVDDIEVFGFYIKPKKVKGEIPIIVYNRGGNQNFGRVNFPQMMSNIFPIANEGFAIIGSQYRGTQTRNTTLDEFGGSDVNDVIRLLDIIPSLADIDKTRIGMYGESRGGMQTFLTLKQTAKVKAAAVVGAASNLLEELKHRPFMEKIYQRQIPNYEENKVLELEKRSVIKWVEQLPKSTPILLMHGENDTKVSVENSTLLAESFAANNVPHKLIIYPDDSHGLFKNKEKAFQEIVNWFRENI